VRDIAFAPCAKCARYAVVDTATIVRRAFGATSNPARAQNAHVTSVVDITAMP